MFDSHQVQHGQAHIEMEMEAFLAPGLAVGKAGELFGIPEDKFDLEASGVGPVDKGGAQGEIGGEEQDISATFSFSVLHIDQFDLSVQKHTVNHRRIQADVFVDLFLKGELGEVGGLGIELSGISFRATPFAGVLFFIGGRLV